MPGGASTVVGDASGRLLDGGAEYVGYGAGRNTSWPEHSWRFHYDRSMTPGYASPKDLLNASWQALAVNGSLYLLDPPTTSAKDPSHLAGFTALYKINLTTGAVSQSRPTS